MSKNGNEPAYPGIEGVPGYGNQTPITGPNGLAWVCHNQGLTKRELIAAMAMQGICAGDHENKYSERDVTQWAVSMADALLAELAKEKELI